ncbi:GNAT family N-acetyltransferase [Salinarimonas soli]|nr:GNAT family N-acetyltransferase [Salinarimonas soli]
MRALTRRDAACFQDGSAHAMGLPSRPDAGLRIELRSGAAARDVAGPWADLARRAVEPNIFAGSDFMIPAMERIAGRSKVSLLCLWRGDPGGPRLVGALPLAQGGRLISAFGARSWRPSLSSLGHPLIDADDPESTIEALLDALRAPPHRASSLVLPQVPMDGPFARALAAVADRTGRRIAAYDRHERAVLRSGPAGLSIRKRTLKELGRQRRRLEEAGPVAVERASDIDGAFETFVALEASGWKGARGTALAMNADALSVMRETVRGLAAHGSCRIDLLRVGPRCIAGALVVWNAGHGWFWKVAYDEAFARYSPGVQLALEVTRDILAAGDLTIVDSCAVRDHPMIDHLWHDRMPVADLVVGTRPDAPVAALASHVAQTLARSGRAAAKKAYHLVKGERR